MYELQLDTQLGECVSDIGKCIFATTAGSFSSRDSSTKKQRNMIGASAGLTPLKSRAISEAEALERITWMYGAFWNKFEIFENRHLYIPEEMLLQKLTRNGDYLGIRLDSHDRCNSVPWDWVFCNPKISMYPHHLTTTGWAFHTDKETAKEKGISETIERDLAMLFWIGELNLYLEKNTVTRGDFIITKDTYLSGEILSGHLSIKRDDIEGEQIFCVLGYLSDQPPYLTCNTAIGNTYSEAFESAYFEMLLLREYQEEMYKSGFERENLSGFGRHIWSATFDVGIRDRAKALFGSLRTERTMPVYNISSARNAFVKPPHGYRGYVCKAFVDGCQPMFVETATAGITDRWEKELGIREEKWQSARTHPFP